MSTKPNKSKTAFRIQAMGGEATIWVYGEIGQGISQISAKSFQDELANAGDVSKLLIRINSPGGAVSEVLAILSILSRHPASVRVEVDGFALSCGSLLAMAGDQVAMSENALMMIHSPWTEPSGNAAALRKSADALDAVADQMVKIYATKTGISEKRIQNMMDAETWLSADEALQMGFCDEITLAQAVAASFDISTFNVPKRFKENSMTTESNQNTKLDADAISARALKAETERRTDIRAIFGKYSTDHRELLDTCLDDSEITGDIASRKLLDVLGAQAQPAGQVVVGSAHRQSPPKFRASGSWGHTDSRLSEFTAAATDALLLRNGIPVRNPSPAAADLKNTSVVAMAESCLSMAGMNVRGCNTNRILSAAHSTSDFPALLSGVAEKSLMHGFNNEPASHAAWVRTVEVKDFKEIQRVQRSEAPALLEVPEGAEYTEGTFGERKETYHVKTYGRLFSITRQALINDDLGAFTTLPEAFGASARRVEADYVYRLLTDNANMADGTPLFHADHGNLAGSGGGIDFSNLGAARAAMRRQKGTNGAILNIVPRFLIVPAVLESQAETLLASMSRPGQENSGVANAEFIRSLELIVDPRLDEDSETAWYLAGASSQVDTVELAYLDGARGLDYEEREGWETDGMGVKARLDFGTKAIDWRGMYKNPGS